MIKAKSTNNYELTGNKYHPNMNLYERDFTILTADEELAWHDLREKEVVGNIGKFPVRRSLLRQYPKAARHFNSYFPNHYLDIVELSEKERLTTQLNGFSELLNCSEVNERKILEFINYNHGYFLVACILRNYYVHFGHHGAYLFPEFQIGKSLPDEFTTMDKSRLHFAVVAGRRNDFKEKTYRIRRKKWNDEKVLILHYDNLIDSARNIIGSTTY